MTQNLMVSAKATPGNSDNELLEMSGSILLCRWHGFRVYFAIILSTNQTSVT